MTADVAPQLPPKNAPLFQPAPSFWNTPFRFGWIIRNALLQTGRHADAIYTLFLILFLELFLGPTAGQLTGNFLLSGAWQGLTTILMLTLMAGWMQQMHSRSWLLMIEEMKRYPGILRGEYPPLCPFVEPAQGVTPEMDKGEKDASTEGAAPAGSRIMLSPVQASDENDKAIIKAIEADRPAFMRPVLTPLFQGVGRFWGRSLVVNLTQALLLTACVLAPFVVIYTVYGVPETLMALKPAEIEAMIDANTFKTWLAALPPAEIQVISKWMMGITIAMMLTLIGFMATALWWSTLLVLDTTPLKALGMQWRFFRKDPIRFLFAASSQLGPFGFILMYNLLRVDNFMVNSFLQIGLFLGFLFMTHLAFLYVYSLAQPELLTDKQKTVLKEKAGHA
jgi:hypothetical protein